MATCYTGALREQLASSGADVTVLAAAFDAWKTIDWRANPEAEFDNYRFGKDSAYAAPKIDGRPYELRHVHLVPILDQQQLVMWDRAHERRSRKTSDRALVYVSGSAQDHLLLFVLEEPLAHEVAKMSTPVHKRLMEQFAVVGAAFLRDGSIIA